MGVAAAVLIAIIIGIIIKEPKVKIFGIIVGVIVYFLLLVVSFLIFNFRKREKKRGENENV